MWGEVMNLLVRVRIGSIGSIKGFREITIITFGFH
jgi:hypothetical protein